MTPRVALVMGSDSDWPQLEPCAKQLREFGESLHIEVMSAHRNPARVSEFATGAERAGFRVIIAAAGLSAALPGTIAAHTTLPVIGVPLASGPLNGVDALLSMVQMPPGVPVATMGIGAIGAKNAAFLAIQILATTSPDLSRKWQDFRARQAAEVSARNDALQRKLTEPK